MRRRRRRRRRKPNYSLSRCSSHVVWWSDVVVRIDSNRDDSRNDRGTYMQVNDGSVTLTYSDIETHSSR